MDDYDSNTISLVPDSLTSLILTFGASISQPAEISELSLCDLISAIKCGQIKGKNFAPTIAQLRSPELNEALQKQLKTTLPWFSMGTFRHRRAEADFLACRGMVLDFDHLADIERAKAELIELIPAICCVFRSPRDGVKAVILFDQPVTDNIYYRSCYEYMVREVEQLTGYQADKSCKDVSRAHFLSYDVDLLYRPLAQPFEIANINQKLISQINATAHAEQIVDTQRIEHTLYQAPKETIVYPEDKTRDLELAKEIVTFLATKKLEYRDWIKVGCALKREFDDWGFDTWLIFTNNPFYTDTEADLYRFWNSFRHPASHFGSIVYVGEKYGYRNQ